MRALAIFLLGLGVAGPSVAQTPLTDLGSGLYRGQFQGGLYDGGLNTPPAGHLQAGLDAAAAIQPLDANGQPSASGRIGLVSVTMSNALQQWGAFKRMADEDPYRNAAVQIVNGAVSGQAVDVIFNPNSPYWQDLAVKIADSGLTPEQVQVVWFKAADAQPSTLAFPAHATQLKVHLGRTLQILKATYPNLRIAYISSRSYGGYSPVANRSEPLSYETGFSVKWLIEDQIAGDPRLNWDPAVGAERSPLVLWGPYLWADGLSPRNDGLAWAPNDFEPDGVHPSRAGEAKVGSMLMDFFRTEATATPWFLAPAERRVLQLPAAADAWVDANRPTANFGSTPSLSVQRGARASYLKFDLSGLSGTVESAELCLPFHPDEYSKAGLEVHLLPSNAWDEATLTFQNRPTGSSGRVTTFGEISRGTLLSLDVTQLVQTAGNEVSFLLAARRGQPDNRLLLSQESGGGAYLVVTEVPSVSDPAIPYSPPAMNSTGQPGLLSTLGSSSQAANDLRLVATQLPPHEDAWFFYATGWQRRPHGDGLLGVSNPVDRVSPPVVINAQGRARIFARLPQLGIATGTSLYMQCLYLDPGGSAGFNLTNALRIQLEP